MKKEYLHYIITIFLIICVLILAFLYFREKNIVGPEEEPTWNKVTELVGASKGGNYPFSIQGDKFRITYVVSQDENYLDLLTLFVVRADLFNQQNNSDTSNFTFNQNKSVTIIFPIMKQMGVAPITLTYEEYQVYQGKAGIVTNNVNRVIAWEDEQRFENSGKIFGINIPEDYVNSLGERKKDRNNYTDFFYSYNTPSQTNISLGGAGNYYLIVESYGLESWKIVIEDYY